MVLNWIVPALGFVLHRGLQGRAVAEMGKTVEAQIDEKTAAQTAAIAELSVRLESMAIAHAEGTRSMRKGLWLTGGVAFTALAVALFGLFN